MIRLREAMGLQNTSRARRQQGWARNCPTRLHHSVWMVLGQYGNHHVSVTILLFSPYSESRSKDYCSQFCCKTRVMMQAIVEPNASTNLWLLVLAVGRLACEDAGTGAVLELEQSCPVFRWEDSRQRCKKTMSRKKLKSKTLWKSQTGTGGLQPY